MSHVMLNGQIKTADKAFLSCLDRGLTLGDGLFETIAVRAGIVQYLDDHWSRLSLSAKKLNINLPLTFNQLVTQSQTLLTKNKVNTGGLRFTVTRGQSERRLLPTGHEQAQCLLTTFDMPLIPVDYSLTIASIRSNESSPLSGIKTISYLENILVKQEAVLRGFDDGLRINSLGQVTETSCANFFLIEKDAILTPPLCDGVLPGVFRQEVLRFCREHSYACFEQSFDLERVQSAQAAFISNALCGIVPIRHIDDWCFTGFASWQKRLAPLIFSSY